MHVVEQAEQGLVRKNQSVGKTQEFSFFLYLKNEYGKI